MTRSHSRCHVFVVVSPFCIAKLRNAVLSCVIVTMLLKTSPVSLLISSYLLLSRRPLSLPCAASAVLTRPSCFIQTFIWNNGRSPVPPAQGVGSDNRRGSQHAHPPQRGRSPPALRQRLDGHLLQGQIDRRLGHGLPHWHQPTPCPRRAPGRCERGRLWRQIYSVGLRGSHHQGNRSASKSTVQTSLSLRVNG